jgi:hypothetical protein
MKRANRLLIGVSLVIAIAALAVLSMRWGIASLDLWKARQAMQQMRTEQMTLDARIELVQTALARLDKADSYNPGNPDVMDQRGQFYYWQAMNTTSAGHDRGEMLEKVVGQYRQSLAIRPMWPYTWANLVVAKADWGIFDQEFRRAVRRTVELGPWEPRVQLLLIKVDFAEQGRIDRRSRNLIDGILQNAILNQPLAVINLAARWRQLPRVCSQFEDEALLSQCRRKGWTPDREEE